MRYAYNAIYLVLLAVLSPWVLWRVVVQRKNRRGWKQKLFGFAPARKLTRPCVWIHAVSVGEVNLLIPFLNAFRVEFPGHEFAISTTTETGYELAEKRFPEAYLFFCPSDFSWAVNNALDRIQPDMLILTELELWPNLISITRSRQIPVALINGRISEKSFRGYRRINPVVRRILQRLDSACVQTETYRQRLELLGMSPEKIDVTGNLKFDNIQNDLRLVEDSQQLAELANLADNDFVFIAGSTQENEDRLAISVFKNLQNQHPQLKLILVPRHPERCKRLATILREAGLEFEFRSKLPLTEAKISRSRILIVDVIGELGAWWKLADAGYVGGSMGTRGGQNMIEPAANGVPISFGPDTANFRDVVELLIQNSAAVVVENESQLKQFVASMIRDRAMAKELGQWAMETIMTQRGATKRTISALRPLLNGADSSAAKSHRAA